MRAKVINYQPAMEKIISIFSICFLYVSFSFAQQILLKGSVKEDLTFQPLQNVAVFIEDLDISTITNELGEFEFMVEIPLGEQILRISKVGYITKRYPIVIAEGKILNIEDMTLEVDNIASEELFTITLSEDQLHSDENVSDNISGLLASSMDIFQRTAAFEFSSSFFRVRGLDSEHATIMLNGIEMNKVYNGRPQWSNWGGLNDVMRNQEMAFGLSPSSFTFGGAMGSTSINLRPSQMRPGGRITYSSSNRSYTNRTMANYTSGMAKNGFAYTLSVGRRWGEEGFQEGTVYNANSFLASIEKKFSDQHSLNLIGIYAPNRRGKSSPNTQEVYDLKGIQYNEYWGWQNGKKRNSRIKEVAEPIFMLNHYWTINDNVSLNSNIAYQFGKVGNSRLAFGGDTRAITSDGQEYFEGSGRNPSPTYYQKLPSYFERNFPNDLEFAYGALNNFLEYGQIDWNAMYEANATNLAQGRNVSYMLYEDRNDDKQWTFNTVLNGQINEHFAYDASINYQKLKSENFAEVLDLLGGSGFLNVDSFDGVQFDLQNPNSILKEGDKFNYHYNMFADVVSGFGQIQLKYPKWDAFLSAGINHTQYKREGLFQPENFAEKSLGEGENLAFTGIGSKAGVTYKLTGKHVLNANAGYITKAPSIANSYTNLRFNNNVVPNISEEKIKSFDASYIFRSPFVKAKLTGFYSTIVDANEISFFFADGIGNVITNSGDQTGGSNDSEFIQEILQGIDKQHIGAEIGIEAQVTPSIKLKGAGSYGQYTYVNNPNLYVSSDRFENVYLGNSFLKNYRLPAGPQQAYSVGFEYRDPDYWWIGATANFFSDTYIDVSSLMRTNNFYTDVDGLPFNDYDENVARNLLKQERFDDYMVVNLIGGKSWKIDNYYIGFFASMNNLFDEVYKTGGFEQGRNANYRQLRDDSALEKPVFGSKYWYGRGTNYFLNVNIRF